MLTVVHLRHETGHPTNLIYAKVPSPKSLNQKTQNETAALTRRTREARWKGAAETPRGIAESVNGAVEMALRPNRPVPPPAPPSSRSNWPKSPKWRTQAEDRRGPQRDKIVTSRTSPSCSDAR